MSIYIKEFLSTVEIENKICQRCSKLKTPVELISDKLIMSLEGLPTSNLPSKIDHPKCTILTKNTVALDVILQKYFKDSFLDDVICDFFSSGGSESMKSTFTVSIYLKKPPLVLMILFHRGKYYRETYKHPKNKKKKMSGSTDVLFVVYIRTSHLKNTALIVFINSQQCPESLI